MIDNFDKIIPLLEFPKKDDSFYFVQVLQRKKDHPGTRVGGSNNNSRLIKAYQIKSVDHLLIHKEEMIKLGDLFNARVGINLNPRSFEKMAFQVIQKIANQMQNKDFQGARKAYDSVCGNYHAEMDKRWLVDIDSKEEAEVSRIEECIKVCHAQILNREYKILAKLETKGGYHLISNPFNLELFHNACPHIEVHKNNPTLLYCP
jgi:hypothetical protein